MQINIGSISEAFSNGGRAYKSNLVVWLLMILFGGAFYTGLQLIYIALLYLIWVLGNLPGTFTIVFNVWLFLGILVSLLFILPLNSGFIYATVLSTRSEHFSFATLFHFFRLKRYLHITLHAIVATIPLIIITILGLGLLLLPGIYFITRFYFTYHFIIDQRIAAHKAIAASWQVTRGSNFWNIFGLVSIILIISVFLLIVPFTMLIFSYSSPSIELRTAGLVMFAVISLLFIPWIACVISASYNLLIGKKINISIKNLN